MAKQNGKSAPPSASATPDPKPPSQPTPKTASVPELEARIAALESLMAEFQPFVGPPLSEKLARYLKPA